MVIASASDQVCMRARLKTPCHACKANIEEGQEIHPYEGIGWMHLVCAEAYCTEARQPIHRPVCKHWRKRGYCLYKDKCYYHHPVDALPAPKAPPAVRKPGEKLRDPKKQNRGPGKRNRVNNRFRAGVFRRFLLDEFGDGVLRSGSGVLDVAGGKGEVAFELVNLNGIPSTVIDPRPLCLNHFCRWLLGGFCHRNTIFRRYIHRPLSLMQRAEDLRAPQHLRILLEAPIVDALAPRPSHQDASLQLVVPSADGAAESGAEGSVKTRRPRRDRHPAPRDDHPVHLVEPEEAVPEQSPPEQPLAAALSLGQPRESHGEQSLASGQEDRNPTPWDDHPAHLVEPHQSVPLEHSPAAALAPGMLCDVQGGSSSISGGAEKGGGGADEATAAREAAGGHTGPGDDGQHCRQSSSPTPPEGDIREIRQSLQRDSRLQPGRDAAVNMLQLDHAPGHGSCISMMNGGVDDRTGADPESAEASFAEPEPADHLAGNSEARSGLANGSEALGNGSTNHQPGQCNDRSAAALLASAAAQQPGQPHPAVCSKAKHQPPSTHSSSFASDPGCGDDTGSSAGAEARRVPGQKLGACQGHKSAALSSSAGLAGGHAACIQGQWPDAGQADSSTPAAVESGPRELSSAAPPDDWPEVFAASLQKGASLVWGIKGLKGARHEDGTMEEGDSDGDESVVTTLPGEPEDDPITDVQQAWQVLREASCIIGMHPDQAAGAIVEYALRTGKPFAVVPCCVYSCDFPNRHLPDGRLVKQYEDLIDWLVALDPAHIKVADLLIDGRNKVVYGHGRPHQEPASLT